MVRGVEGKGQWQVRGGPVREGAGPLERRGLVWEMGGEAGLQAAHGRARREGGGVR